jgi:hypothetical protein
MARTMEHCMEYGIKCNKEDEKQIVKNINNFLRKEYNYRKMYKWEDDAITKFKYEYYYCQFTKTNPHWLFDLNPNEDLNGKRKFENKEVQWVLFTTKNKVEEYTKKQHEEIDLFFKKLLEAVGFEIILLHKYKKDEIERIGNIIYDEDGNEIEN